MSLRLTILALALVALPDTSVAQGRDRAAAATGTASISGRVLTDSQPPRPIRRAVVTLNSGDRTVGRTVVSDDEGRFALTGLPAGRYTLNASKRGWVTMAYGARTSNRPGRAIPIADGERATATIVLPRAAVITGVVLDAAGQPLEGIAMRAMRYGYNPNSGERSLNTVGFTGADERGVYRIYGLAAGEYYVSAVSGSFQPESNDLHLTTDVDVQEAMRAVQAGPSGPAADVPQRNVGFAPVFYPGTTSVAQATLVSLRAGEERAGVDFTIQYVATAHVSGSVQGPDGPATSAQLMLFNTNPSNPDQGFMSTRNARVAADGSFDFPDITPGPYTLTARLARPGPGGASAPPQLLSGSADIEVQGEDVGGVSVVIQEGLTVSGRVVADGTAPPPSLGALRATLSPQMSGNTVTITNGSTTTSPDGRFTMTGVSPGRYRLTVVTPPPWTMRSSMIGGQDSKDVAVEIRQSVADAVITLTDRKSQLSGRIQAPPGGSAECFVILFPENRTLWAAGARRILAAPSSSDGTFSFPTVLPGDYLIAAVDDVEQGEWWDPAFLQRLVPASMKISIAEGEKKVQDVKIGGGL
jgi:protocatechuate 3,4-dioxygenase beta subunit